MKPDSTSSINSGLKENSVSNFKYGIASVKTPFLTSSENNRVSTQTTDTVKPKPVPTESSTTPQNYLTLPLELSAPLSRTANIQHSKADSIQKVPKQQITSQLQLFLNLVKNSIPLVFLTMLILNGFKLDLKLFQLKFEVPPALNRIEQDLHK